MHRDLRRGRRDRERPWGRMFFGERFQRIQRCRGFRGFRGFWFQWFQVFQGSRFGTF
jgi:hypothetical protein